LSRGRQDRAVRSGVRSRECGYWWTAVLTGGRRSSAGPVGSSRAPCHALPGRVGEEVSVNQAYDLAWCRAGRRRSRGDLRERRSNKRMQLTKGGWRSVETSWSVVPRMAAIVGEGKVVRPSQLIRSVRRTKGETGVREAQPMGLQRV
jgi:hypothetical protein